MADVDDELLIAYLEAFLQTSPLQTPPWLEDLRGELESLGAVPAGSHPAEWAALIRARREAVRNARTPEPPAQAVPAPQPPPAAPTPAPATVPQAPAEPATWQSPTSPATPTPPAVPPVGTSFTPPAVSATGASAAPVGDLFAAPAPQDQPGVAPSGPEAPSTSSEPEYSPEYSPEYAPDYDDYVPIDESPMWDAEWPSETVALDGDLSAPVESTTATAPAGPGSSDLGEESLPDLWAGPLGDTPVADERWSPSPIKAKTEVTHTPAPAPAVPPAPLTPPVPEQPEPTTAAIPAAEPLSAPTQVVDISFDDTESFTVHEAPLRPQLFSGTTGSSKSKSRTRKQVRTQAEAPEPLDGATAVAPATALPDWSAPAQQAAGLTDSVRDALRAAVDIPYPMFTSDLAQMFGASIVEQWVDECRGDPGNSTVRFIGAKTRHKLRGALVVIEDAAAGDQSRYWAPCVGAFRGARLYEMAVLLRRVGDNVVDFRYRENSAVLHLKTPAGLVTLIVMLDTGLDEGTSVRGELLAHLQDVSIRRLAQVVILTTSAEPGSMEGLIAAVQDLSTENGLRFNAPVIAARSWEYADDRGSSAVNVFDA